MAGGIGTSTRVAETTIEEWSKTVSEETEKYLVQLAMMKSKGKIKYGCSGNTFRWVVRKKDHALKAFEDFVPTGIERVNTKTAATLEHRGYYVQDAISIREKAEQSGPEAMIKIFANREELMRDGAMRGLADELYVDGNANGNEHRFHGIESFMTIATGQVDTDELATALNDSYGGLSTVAQAVGGPAQPKVWSPTVVSTDVAPSGTPLTWDGYATEFLRRAFLNLTYGSGPRDRPDLAILTLASYEDLLNLMESKERINVQRGASLKLTKLGFENSVQLDGVPIVWEAACPATDAQGAVVNGYVYTCGRMELKVLGAKQLFTTKVTFNDSYHADNIFMHLFGNLKFESPRHFGKLAAIRTI